MPLPVPGVEQLGFDFTDMIIVPATGGFISGFGAPCADGGREQAYGLTALVPSYRSFAAAGGGGNQRAYERRVIDRELWAGAGYARRWGPKLRFGLALHYVLRTISDQERVTAAPIVGTEGTTFQLQTSSLDVTAGSVLALLGAKWLPSPDWALGAALQLPSLGLHGQARLRQTQARADPRVNAATSTAFSDQDLLGGANAQRSVSLRLGGRWSQPESVTVTADLSLHAPIRYALIDLAPAVTQRLAFNPEVERRPVANLSLGIEYLVISDVSVAAGAFTDLSSAPPVPRTASVKPAPHIDLLGLTTALGYFTQHTLTRLGFVYTFGEGDDALPNFSGNSATCSNCRCCRRTRSS